MRILQEGDIFGESALKHENNKRFMTIKAFTDVRCLSLGRDMLNNILGEQMDIIRYKNICKWNLEEMNGYSRLTEM